MIDVVDRESLLDPLIVVADRSGKLQACIEDQCSDGHLGCSKKAAGKAADTGSGAQV